MRVTRRPCALVALALATIHFEATSAIAAERAEARLVVVIYPDESDGAPGIVAVNRALRSKFTNESPVPVIIRNEFVDTSRSRDARFVAAQVALLQQKYAGRKVDLVIAGLSSGLDFAVEHRAKLFPGAPIVYVAVDQREISPRQLPPDVVGVPIQFDLAGTLELALKLHQDTERVFVVAGNAPFDLEWAAEARHTFRPYHGQVEFTYLVGLPMADLAQSTAQLPPRSIIYYLNIHRDGAGNPLFPAEALERFAATANAPIYGHVDTYVGRGIVGGHVFSFEEAGKNAAALGLRLLAGEDPRAITKATSNDNSFIFDARQLQRWRIDRTDLPAGSTIHFQEPSFWREYKWYVAGVTLLFAIQSSLLTGLLVQRAKRRRADRRFREVIEGNPTGMLVIADDGKIILANVQIERLFGYTKQEVLGQYVEALIPERFRAHYSEFRRQFAAVPAVCALGADQDFFGRRKDGSEFPVEIGLSPIRTPQGLCVLAAVVDISERKRAGELLHSSEQQLKALAGKLLDAHESERRRIARELHDDLNQDLALLSVELDLLHQQSPSAAGGFAERMHALCLRVRQLSSTVHDLSHQLHPAKLEQLGLTAAVRGLCKELMQSHGLRIHFTEAQVPANLPEDSALCLYRIAQEALRNVTKHSGTNEATVELTATTEFVRLRIADDGVGFDPAAALQNGGLGLISMRERLHLIGGEIVIDSRPSGGTSVISRVPLHNGWDGQSSSPDDTLETSP